MILINLIYCAIWLTGSAPAGYVTAFIHVLDLTFNEGRLKGGTN